MTAAGDCPARIIRGNMAFQIKWIGQGGYILTLGDKLLCVDPYLSDACKIDGAGRIIPIPFAPSELKVDMIVSTHDHEDHLDEETIRYTDYDHTLYGGPSSCIRHFKALGIPETQLRPLNRGETIGLGLGGAVIHGVYAEHTPDSIGVVVDYEGVSVYIAGDSLFSEKLSDAKRYHPDILICCINGKLGNMPYTDTARVAKMLEVQAAVPSHYGMFAGNTEDPERLNEALAGSGIKYFEMEMEKTYDIGELL